MKVSIFSPEIASLRSAVELEMGFPMKTPRHFTALSYEIEDKLNYHLSETTLQRIWLYKAGYDTVAIHSLNILCQFIHFGSWECFCQKIRENSPAESDMFSGISIKVEQLKPGTLLRIGWQPDRICIIKYLGNYRFEAIETHNAKLCAGDRFSCTQMQLGREMYLDNLVRGESDLRYVVGSRNGLTTMEILEKD